MQPTINEFDNHIERLKEQVKLKDVLIRLRENPDFKQVIDEEYLKNEAIRLVEAKGSPELSSEESQRTLDNNIMGVSILRQYFQRIMIMGDQAERSLEGAYSERQRLLDGEQE